MARKSDTPSRSRKGASTPVVLAPRPAGAAVVAGLAQRARALDATAEADLLRASGHVPSREPARHRGPGIRSATAPEVTGGEVEAFGLALATEQVLLLRAMRDRFVGVDASDLSQRFEFTLKRSSADATTDYTALLGPELVRGDLRKGRHERRDASTGALVAEAELKEKLEDPVVAGDRLLATGKGGKELVAFDLGEAFMRELYRLPRKYGRWRATPSRVFCPGDRGLVALAVEDGRSLWESRPPCDLVAADEQAALVQRGEELTVLDLATGEPRASWSAGGRVQAAWLGHGVVVAHRMTKQVTETRTGTSTSISVEVTSRLTVIDQASGEVRFDRALNEGDAFPRLALTDDVLYLACPVTQGPTRVEALDLANGQALFASDLELGPTGGLSLLPWPGTLRVVNIVGHALHVATIRGV